VNYLPGPAEVPIRDLAGELALASGPNWSCQLRRGLLELTPADYRLIRSAMLAA
jgi:hypothetical protein